MVPRVYTDRFAAHSARGRMNRRAHLVVSGRVQGVWFRASTKEQAERLGLTGWVRNRRNGDVEILAEGNEEALAEFLAWCRRGPRGAEVAKVDVSYEDDNGDFSRFDIAATR